jgi:hypothetical protein
VWSGIQAVLSAALFAALGYAAWVFANFGADLPLHGWQRPGAWVLIAGGLGLFGVRTVRLLVRMAGGRPRP